MKMNVKYQDGRGFSRIAMAVSDLFVSAEEKRDGLICSYGIRYCSKGESIAHNICSFKKKEDAERFILKVYEHVNENRKKHFWIKADYKNTDKIIDLDKIRDEVHDEN